ncbi:MAG: hypothetical protein WAW39_10520 [Prosthecobacter sp.]|uniref:hypothetical protein n=1 Tax=Prosthecobacter sp. TaxID=1965333 RepID=UPI003BB20C25
MADQTLASLTAATPATGGLIYGTQGGSDRKFTVTAAGAALIESTTGIKYPEMAFVYEASGNDTSGAVGDPARPFATIQAAYNAGAKNFSIIGTVGDLLLGSSDSLAFFGVNSDTSKIGTISCIQGVGYANLRGNGRDMVSIDQITFTGDPGMIGTSVGMDGTDGVTSPSFALYGVSVTAITLVGGTGGTGSTGTTDPGSGDGYAGGNAGSGGGAGDVSLYDCSLIGNVSLTGGNGGIGGTGGDAGSTNNSAGQGGVGGNGGSSGSVYLSRTHVLATSIVQTAGQMGAGGGGGSGPSGGGNGADGSPGYNGGMQAHWCEFASSSATSSMTLVACISEGVFSA